MAGTELPDEDISYWTESEPVFKKDNHSQMTASLDISMTYDK